MKQINQVGNKKDNKLKNRAVMAITSTVLVCVLAFSGIGEVFIGGMQELTEPLFVSATGSSITSDSIKDKEQQISKAEQEKQNLQSGLSNLKEMKEELEEKKDNLKDYVETLDGNLADIEDRITSLNNRIEEKKQEIAKTEKELESAQEQEKNQKEYMTKRIRMMYEKGDSYILDTLLQANGFQDFLNRADFIEQIVSYDHQKWEEYKTNREYIELCKQELDLEKEILDMSMYNVGIEQENMENLIEQKNQDITKYESDINTKEAAIKEYEADIAEQDEIIRTLEAAIAEEKRQILANNGTVLKYDGGMFKFPLASYTRMSDDYGWRIHPTLGVEKFHNGVDWAAPKGTAIYAAYDGKVVAATYSASMGNYVMIDHGDDLYTIYMHASALYVSKGDIVVRGDTIAAVGTTGRSTGNHLHFGVRKDGEYVSPWKYLSE
ncbi:MAG: peptidoglycan DD-metalloendopeptidase family protein [Lachnospiraceae bacterium]|nr:peptidoglycan DD-metalloendopeptidase family protein [Lachnospiraceae bacterium]